MIAAGIFSQYRAIEAIARSCDVVAAAIPIAASNVWGTYCAKTLIVCTPCRCHARVVGRLKIKLAPEPVRQSAGAGGLVARLPLCLRKRRVDLAQVVRHVRAGPGLEARQLFECHIQLDGAAGLRDRLDAGSPGGVGKITQQRERRPGIGIGDDAGCDQELAAGELDSVSRG